jgi:hypothetical protein
MIEAASDPGAAQVATPDDVSAIEALRRGDEGTFAHLLAQYHANLRRVARLYISNRAVADEAVQDIWAWRDPRHLGVRGPLGTQDLNLSHPHQPREDPRRTRRTDGADRPARRRS